MKIRHFRIPTSLVASLAVAMQAAAADAPAKQPAPPQPADRPVAPDGGADAGECTIVVEAGQAQLQVAPGGDNPAPADQAGVVVAEAQAIPAEAPRAYLGIGARPTPKFLQKHLQLAEGNGVLVEDVDANGPAAKAGIAKDDVITKVAGKPVASQRDIAEIVGDQKIGGEIEVESIHDGKPTKQKITLGERPAGQPGGDVAVDADEPMFKNLQGFGANLPPEQQKLLREAMENARKQARNNGPGMHFQVLPGGAGALQLNAGGALQLGPGGPQGAPKKGFQMNMSSNIRMMDQEGSVELKQMDGGTEANVLDKAGKVVWSGSWDTEQDKAAAPPDIRQRIDRINGSMKLNNIMPRLNAAEPNPPNAPDAPEEAEDADSK